MKTSLIFYPNLPKKNAKTGKTPIYMRVCFQGKKSETRLNTELDEQHLLIWDKMAMRVAEKNSPVNQYLKTDLCYASGQFNLDWVLNSVCIRSINSFHS
jgi:hypothetical protein